MRIFPTRFAAEKDRKVGARPFYILECPFPSTGTIFIADHCITTSSWKGGITTKSWSKGWGQIAEDIGNEQALTKVSTFSLGVIIDPIALPNIETVLETAANNVEITDCFLYLAYYDLLGALELTDPPQLMWAGNMIDPDYLDELTMRVEMVDRSVRVDKYVGTKLSLTDYPDAHPDDVGKVMNIVYGANNMVPGLRADWSAQTTLKTGIDDTYTTSLELSDASRFPSTGSIWIDEEKIAYASKTGNVLNTLTRAQAGTTGAVHSVGAGVIEAKTQYDSVLASHALKTITSIFAEISGNRLRVDAGVTALVVNGKQILRAIEQITLAPTGEAAIVDTIEVSDPGHAHSDAGAGTPVSGNLCNGNSDGSGHWYTSGSSGAPWDGDLNTVFTFYFNTPGNTSGWAYLDVHFPAWGGGSVSAVYAVLTHSCWAPGGNGSFTCAGQSITNNGNKIQQKIYVGATYPSSVRVYGSFSNNNSCFIQLYELSLEVHSEATTENKANVLKTGSVTISGMVFTKTVERFLALCDGYADDSSGSVTGTPLALIERPDHVTNHFLYTYAGNPLASFYSDAATKLAAIYKFAVVINEYKTLKTWLAKFAWESRCYFRFAPSRAELLLRPDTLLSDKTITANMIKMDETGRSSMRVKRSPIDEIINKIALHYDRDATKTGDEAYRGMIEATDAISITRYSEYEKPELFYFDFVQSAAMAQEVLNFYLARFAYRKKIATMTLFLDNAELEFADGITIEPLGNLLCEIEKANLAPGSAKDMRNDTIEITAREY
jgi:hypothetical protein